MNLNQMPDQTRAIADVNLGRGASASNRVSADAATIRAVMVGIMLAMFLSALEQTIVAPALPTIGRSLNDINNLSWVVSAYLLSATAVTPLFGKLSDIYGRRAIMLLGVSIFILGSVACALAPTMWALVLGRALQGVGGGGILPLAHTIVADLVTPRERPRVQSYTSVMFMAASILGPVLGGFLTDYWHWSMIFWINVPLGAIALAMTDRALRRLPRHDRPHRLDLAGAALMVAAAIALMLALSWGGKRYPWTSPEILGLGAASVLFWVLFWLRLRRAPEPFIPLAVMKDPVVVAIVFAGFFSIGAITGLAIYVPLYLELVLGLSASASGLALISFMVGATIGSLICGRLMARLDRYKRVPIVGLLIGIVALCILAANPAGFSLFEISALLALCGLGLGTMYPLTTVVIQNVVLPHQMGTATGLLNFFRLLGGAFIVAGFGAIVLGSVDGGQVLDLDRLGHVAPGAGADFAVVFRLVFVAAAACVGLALAAMAFMAERPLQGPARAALEAEQA